MTGYIVEVQEDDQENLFIQFPDELIDELGWQEGDILKLGFKGFGYCVEQSP
jgi:hypothetical protein